MAGVEAARFAKSQPAGNSAALEKQAKAAEDRAIGLVTKTGGKEKPSDLRKEMCLRVGPHGEAVKADAGL